MRIRAPDRKLRKTLLTLLINRFASVESEISTRETRAFRNCSIHFEEVSNREERRICRRLWQEYLQQDKPEKAGGPFASLWNALLARRGMMAYLPITFVTIAMFCGASWQVFLPLTDPARYQCYALLFWLGSRATVLLPASQCAFLSLSGAVPPFHLLPLEYPPLTLLLFSLALLAPLPYYQLAFALLMSLILVLIYSLLLHYGPRGAALVFACYIFIGAIATAQGRFDLLPAALTLLCIIAAERKQWTWAYVALALGVLIKLYPVLLFPILFIAEQQTEGSLSIRPQSLTLKAVLQHPWTLLREIFRWHWRNSLIFLGVLIGVTGIFALFNFQGAFVDQFRYFAQRPVQIEATGSILLWLATAFGYPLHIVSTYGSLNIMSELDGPVALGFEMLLIVGYVYTLRMQLRGKLDVTQGSIAVLLLFVATGKVFSPQYLIWLMPLLAYAGAFDRFWLLCWGAVSLLTTFIFTYLYSRVADSLLIPYVPGFVPAVSIRNALFVLLTLAYLFNWFQARRRKLLPPRFTGRETRRLYDA